MFESSAHLQQPRKFKPSTTSLSAEKDPPNVPLLGYALLT